MRPSDVIGRTVKLRKQGREYVGLSPFTKEKTPSFYVNDDKGQFFDFSSGKTGDIITFLQETERLSFMEAVERLAAEAGVPLPAPDLRTAEQDTKRKGLLDWLDLAGKWFEAELRRPSGTEARAYLERRGLSEVEWGRFRIGFAPTGRTALKDYLVAKGAKPVELVEAGLLIAPEEGSAPYDRFRRRIIFPITDVRGRVVSFGGRSLDPGARAKYLNGPETPVFHKGHQLYGLFDARKILSAAAPADSPPPLVVVEGYMDVIACQRAGVPAVAPMGTALGEDQMELLWRFHPEPTLSFDGDAAGKRAADRVIDRALPMLKAGRSFRFAFVKGGKDPDDVLREQGPTALRAQLADATPFVARLFDREADAGPLDTPERRAGLKARLRQFAAAIPDKDLAEQYRSDLFERFYSKFHRRKFSREAGRLDFVDGFRGLLDKTLGTTLKSRIRQFNAAVAVAAVDHPDWIRKYDEQLALRGFGDKGLAPLVQPLLDAIQEDHFNRDLVLLNIKSDSASTALQKARATAAESGVYPFLNDHANPQQARETWEHCFEVMLAFSAIEDERQERKQALELREPVLDSKILFERGQWIRVEQVTLASMINSGELWGASTTEQSRSFG
ncbi:MAG: primase [Phenylobacterium sp.]|nr:primase [Phenylobacterium sp.]